ncbi:glycosyltransferase family 2 protein [Bryobacter aggregatus]|uniref:glycosyltransferase family 2 protein n=1 Tax=Bryobacter aggregatus TaxID=360054 RepID=UPI0004E0B6D5|nr:glycosyltransferase family 2 protein [Bryobacter aggregatus]
MVSSEEAIHVVVPTWRGREHLAQLLPSLAAQTLQPTAVILVDGASEDGSREVAAEYGATWLDLGKNLGFAAAVHAGIEASTAHRIAILNNDIRLAPDWLECLARVDASFAVGKVLQWQHPERIDATWDLASLSGVPMRAGAGKRDSAYWNRGRSIDLAPWTAILLNREYWEATGGLDLSFESYLEDVDIGLRGSKLGLRGIYEPAAVAWHRGSSTLGAWHPRQVQLTSRNQLKLVARHGGDWWKVIVGQGLWGFAAARHGCFLPWLEGKLEGIRNFKNEADSTALLSRLESEIFASDAATGSDRFWRCYWMLT